MSFCDERPTVMGRSPTEAPQTVRTLLTWSFGTRRPVAIELGRLGPAVRFTAPFDMHGRDQGRQGLYVLDILGRGAFADTEAIDHVQIGVHRIGVVSRQMGRPPERHLDPGDAAADADNFVVVGRHGVARFACIGQQARRTRPRIGIERLVVVETPWPVEGVLRQWIPGDVVLAISNSGDRCGRDLQNRSLWLGTHP